MGQLLAATIDTVHALLMATWVLGLPLLFVRRWPRLTRIYGIFAIGFVVLSQASRVVLGECFLTTISRWVWERTPGGAPPPDIDEWFTIRLAEAIFHMAPSHRAVTIVSEALVVVTALGALLSLRRAPPRPADGPATGRTSVERRGVQRSG